MTLTEDLLAQILTHHETKTEILTNWGTPMGVNGPRPRVPSRIWFDPEVMPSKTQQSFKEETNINNIMAKFRKTQELNHLNERDPTYGDFSTGLDFQASQNAVIAAQADFDSLSAAIRARMGNNPATLLAFMADPENIDEARKLGLINPAPPAEPGPAPEGEPPVGETPIPPSATPVAGGE